MDLAQLRKLLREWYRGKVQAGTPALQALDLVVPGEDFEHGDKDTWQRFSVQTGAAAVTGVGSALKRRTRVGRVSVEIFGERGVGDGAVSALATEVEQIWRDATDPANAIDPLIYIDEPWSFERPETGRYCQVVTVPFRADLMS